MRKIYERWKFLILAAILWVHYHHFEITHQWAALPQIHVWRWLILGIDGILISNMEAKILTYLTESRYFIIDIRDSRHWFSSVDILMMEMYSFLIHKIKRVPYVRHQCAASPATATPALSIARTRPGLLAHLRAAIAVNAAALMPRRRVHWRERKARYYRIVFFVPVMYRSAGK